MRIKPVYEFIGPPEHPDLYPGLRPEKSYVLAKDNNEMMVYPILDKIDIKNIGDCCVYDGRKERKLKDFFYEKTSYNIEDTIPVLTYGANVNPMRLSTNLKDNEKPIVLTLKGLLHNYDIVYMPRVTTYGSIAATITPSNGTKVECWLNLFLPEHMTRIHRFEGCFKNKKRTYEFAIFPNDFDIGDKIKPYYYVGSSGRVFIENDKPISFAGSDYIGKRGNLIANIDFVPIDAEDRVYVEKAQSEMMEKFNEFGEKMPFNKAKERIFCRPSDRERKFEYKLTEWGKENRKMINDYMKQYHSKIINLDNVDIVENPYNINSLKCLKDIA